MKSGLYTYPDLSIVCGVPRVEGGDTLLNPTLIAEILSPSTEGYDRGKKFEFYQGLDSLQEYLLIAQDRISVTLLQRTESRCWDVTIDTEKSAVLQLQSID